MKRIVNLTYSLPQSDLFLRDRPASDEGSQARWQAARQVIDFGCALIQSTSSMRDTSRIRDAVMVALLRRAIVTVEAIWWLLARGLEEPALVMLRTLLDVEVNLRLITMDKTDRMAKRLAAWHYLSYQRHGEKMLRDPGARDQLDKRNGGRIGVIEIAKSYARYLESPGFDDVRKEIGNSQFWHGFANVKDAFDAIGGAADYRTIYGSATFFVHDSNIDADYSELVGSELRLKPFAQRDPAVTEMQLANAVMRFHSMIEVFIEDRGLPEGFAERPSDTGMPDTLRLNSLEGLRALVLEHFGPLAGDAENGDDADDIPDQPASGRSGQP